MFSKLLLSVFLILMGMTNAIAVDCSKRRCKEMNSCQEAMDSLNICGNRKLDGDGDGMPCEAICGDSVAQPMPLIEDNGGQFSCAHKTCKKMGSCEEAYFQLNQCGNGGLDRDGDGIPCEAICGG